jgi:protein-tyrosine-phosphatase
VRGGQVALSHPFIDAHSRGQSGGQESLAHRHDGGHRGEQLVAKLAADEGTEVGSAQASTLETELVRTVDVVLCCCRSCRLRCRDVGHWRALQR